MNQVTMISCMNQKPIDLRQFKKIYLKRRYNLVRRNINVSIGQDNRNIVREFDCPLNKINMSDISSQSGSERPPPLHSNSQYPTPLNNNNNVA